MNKYIKTIITVTGALIVGYCFLFAQALLQDEPHFAILKSLPHALFGVAQVNANLYIAKNDDNFDFIKLIEKEGFIYRE